jgi:hypothetical protein
MEFITLNPIKFSVMNKTISSRSAFTALIAAFLLHNVEEAIFICRYPVENQFPFIQPASCSQFMVSVSILSAAGLAAFIIAMRSKKYPVYNFISTGLAAALLLNVLMPHLFLAIYTLHYTPGLVTAILLNLPLSLMVLIKNRPNYRSTIQFSRTILIFLILGYVLFAITMGLAKIFA